MFLSLFHARVFFVLGLLFSVSSYPVFFLAFSIKFFLVFANFVCVLFSSATLPCDELPAVEGEMNLEVAKARVEERGWGERVEAVLGDATDPGLAGLPPAGSADVVTISYAVTMIPDWKAAIANAKRLLKPGGHLCVCDFTVDPGSQSGVMQKFWTFIFSTDHVHLSPDHVPHLQAEFKQTLLQRGYGTFPYVPGVLKCPYYVYIGQKE